MTYEFEFSDGPGLTFTRAQVEAWVGHPLTDDQVAEIEDVLPNSTLPETVETVAHEALGIEQPEESTCRHCGRAIITERDRWVDPEAGLDVENGDGIWRETCDANDTVTAEHEPETQVSCALCGNRLVRENGRWIDPNERENDGDLCLLNEPAPGAFGPHVPAVSMQQLLDAGAITDTEADRAADRGEDSDE